MDKKLDVKYKFSKTTLNALVDFLEEIKFADTEEKKKLLFVQYVTMNSAMELMVEKYLSSSSEDQAKLYEKIKSDVENIQVNPALEDKSDISTEAPKSFNYYGKKADA